MTTFTVAVLLSAQPSALADFYHRSPGWHNDIRLFQRHDLQRWRGGRWVHRRHGGNLGWWWVVAGIWYFYPSPIYPYPNPYLPPVVAPQSPPVYIEQTPATVAPQTTQYWYYCEPAKAYYPYVATCPSGWQKVPATPDPR